MDFLKLYLDTFEKFHIGIEHLNGLFSYMNREWVKPIETQFSEEKYNLDTDVYTIRVLGHLLFRKYYFEPIRNNLLRSVFDLILQNRQTNELFDNFDHLEKFIQSLLSLGFGELHLYDKIFEEQFLEESRKFYKIKCANVESVGNYISSMLQHLKFEEKMCSRYLLSSTKIKLVNTCVEVMIDYNLEVLFSVLNDWFSNNKREDLKNFFLFIKFSVEGKRRFCQWFQDYVSRIINEQLLDVKYEGEYWKSYVNTLISYCCYFASFVEDVFENDIDIIFARDAGLKYVLAYCKQAAEWLAKKVNLILRGGEKLTEDEIGKQSDIILKLYTLSENQDVFLKFYYIYLARRLIHGTYTQDLELAMLGKLKQTCSFGEIYKLLRMLNDLHLAEKLNLQFKDQNMEATRDIDFSALVLTYGSWPLIDTMLQCNVPSREIETYHSNFQKFYISQYQGRKLQWIPSLSKGIVRASCFNAPYEFQVSMLQLSLLLQFNEQDSWTVKDLKEGSGMDLQVAKQTLDTFLKLKLLETRISSSSLDLNDVIYLNFAFKSKKLRISLYSTSMKNISEEGHDKINQQIVNDRKYAIQAVIVRNMKARKKMEHKELINTVLNQLQQFKPTLLDIKKSIEHLIEMEYLARDKENQQLYTYIA
jgi:cullin 1